MTTIPVVVSRLVDLFRLAAPNVRVDDGPVSTLVEVNDGTDLGIIVGWSPNGASVEADIQLDGAAGDRRETYRVGCAIMASSGDDNSVALRGLVFDTYEALVDRVKQSHPISPGVVRSYMDVVDYTAYPIEQGMAVALRFSVLVSAFDR